MHTKILSEKERKMLHHFLETGEKSKGFRMLKMRIRNNYPRLTDDLSLANEVRRKLIF
jgi:hypothetical protein